MTKTEKKHMIFSNMPSYENCDASECEMRQRNGYCDCAEIALQDEHMNLNKLLDGRVLAIAQLGLWNGQRQGYRILSNNLNSIFGVSQDYNEWYSDGKNVVSNQVHHDGRNHIIFRELREDRNTERFLQEIYNGVDLTPQKIAAYTRSLHPYVAKVYGW